MKKSISKSLIKQSLLAITFIFVGFSGFGQKNSGRLNTEDAYLYPGNDLFISPYKDKDGNEIKSDYLLNFNNDGNLYIRKGGSYGEIIWSSNTKDKKPIKLKVQTNGDMVLYNAQEEKPETSVWSTGTVGRGGNGTFLLMQEDGNLVLYNGTWHGLTKGDAIWATGTCGGKLNGCGSEGTR